MNHLLVICLTSLYLCSATASGLYAADPPSEEGEPRVPAYGAIDSSLLPFAYGPTEKFHYEVSYTGGIKLGELHLEIRPIADAEDEFELYGLITTEDSIFNTIYPIRDEHLTKVKGADRLPYSYEVWQKEGFRYEAHRLTTYYQDEGKIEYRKNDNPVVTYEIDGTTHNEFSSFFSSRIMPLNEEKAFIVPTFADKKRNEVVVRVKGRKHFKKTILGPVDTLEVTPILKFKGLYDKQGDTVIWYTNDECRIPVQITSKIILGSITAELIGYENPACDRYRKIASSK